MISETSFSANYPSIWKTITPMMDEFVRRTNLDGYDRIEIPLVSTLEPARRGLINETAFILFERAVKSRVSPSMEWIRAEIGAALFRAFIYIEGHSSGNTISFSEEESDEIFKLTSRIYRHFISLRTSNIIVSPKFRGCGLIRSCEGDVLVNGNDLYEIKAGDRSFRSVDFRQLVVYLCLHWSDTGILFETINLLNPRTGIRVRIPVETFSRDIAGLPASEFLGNVRQSFSMVGASR